MPPEQNIFEIDEQQKEIAAEEKRKRIRQINDVKEVLKTAAGRRFIWRIWDECGIFRNPFTANANQIFSSSGSDFILDRSLSNLSLSFSIRFNIDTFWKIFFRFSVETSRRDVSTKTHIKLKKEVCKNDTSP